MNVLDRVLRKVLALRTQRNYGSRLSPELLRQVSPRSLLHYQGNIHSQRGQDGILAEIFRRLGLSTGTFVEFGAWDGLYLSNCRFLYEKGWSGVFIEGNARRFRALQDTYRGAAGITAINAYVGVSPDASLGALLKDRGVDPGRIDFVSIDVDGSDLEIFAGLGFRPPVVLLEGGFNFAPALPPVPAEVARQNLQQPLGHIWRVAADAGYRMVCFYQDAYLVRSDLAGPFADIDSDPVSLYRDAFCFMPEDYRESLLAMRRGSAPIRALETAAFGRFDPDPLSYPAPPR